MKSPDLPELKLPKNFLGKISDIFVDKYKVVYLIILTLVLTGMFAFSSIPKETMPDISLNFLFIETYFPGASADDIESLVTDPIEDEIHGLLGIDKITSESRDGVSRITVQFEDGYDMDKAKMEINNKMTKVDFPERATDPYVGVIETGELPIFKVTVTGDYDLVALKTFAKDIKDEIKRVDGVRAVDLTGGYEREIQVIVDFNKLAEYNMDLNTVKDTLGASNINVPAGTKAIDGELLNIRVDESFSTVEEIENLMIMSPMGDSVFLKDIATVKDGYKKPNSYSQIYVAENGESRTKQSVYLSVKRTSGYDIVKPCQEIRDILASASGDIVPEDVELVISMDQSADVKKDLSTVINNAIGGLVTVVIVLFIFIGLNEALIVSTVIPLSLLMALVGMGYFGISINTVSLTGFIIALGLLVDNAIVVMENVDRLREEGATRIDAAKAGANQVAPAVFAATLTTVGAFVPMALGTGVMGKFMAVMPKTVIAVILASLFMSIVVTPMLCARFLPKVKINQKAQLLKSKRKTILSIVIVFALSLFAFADDFKVGIMTIAVAIVFTGVYMVKLYFDKRSQTEGYVGFLDKYKNYIYRLMGNLKQRILIIVLLIAVFIGAIAMVPLGLLSLELFPYNEPNSIEVSVTAPVGTLVDDTRKIVYKAEEKLFAYPDVESFNSSIGGEESHIAMVSIELIDKEERVYRNNTFLEELRRVFGEIPGAKFEVKAVTSMKKMTDGRDIQIGLIGDSTEKIRPYAEQYLLALKSIEGVVLPELSTKDGLTELAVDIDKNRANIYGLDIGMIAQEIRTQVSGIKVGIYKEKGEEYDLTIYYEDGRITSLEDLERIHFRASDGQIVNFSEVASVDYKESGGSIRRKNSKNIIYIQSDVAFGYNASVLNAQYLEAVKTIELPHDIKMEVAGDADELNKQMAKMSRNFLIAMLLVYMVLVIQFNSLTQPIVILLSVPFAIIGVIFGLVITGKSLGFYAMFGIVALVGIAVNDAIVLIDYINYLRGESWDKRSAIAEAVKVRFQPVLATSLTTIGGVMPLALFNPTFSQLGIALIFGLITSTVLTLLVIPIFYSWMDGISQKITGKFIKEE